MSPQDSVHRDYGGAAFIRITTPPRTRFGRIVALVRLVARRYEKLYWKHPTYLAALDSVRNVVAEVVVANDLAALPIALRLGRPVVFDAHEHAPSQFADRPLWGLLMRPYARWQCRRYIPQASGMMTVSQMIADAYERETGVRATVVSNAPRRHHLEATPVHDPVRILHHGAAIRGRGLDEMLRLADLLDERFTLDFVLVESGPGYRDELIHRASGNPRVRFLPAQPMYELVRMANEYDIGLYLLPPTNFNRRAALPNKLFEFIQARLAVAIGPSPEMGRIVRQYRCGVVAADFKPETLARALNELDVAEIKAFKRASNTAADELCSENNADLVLGVVADALTESHPRSPAEGELRSQQQALD